ncbi:O-antigen ligase [Bosea sp. (in: a-proteobacteria)]|uniref:O-antigen ligase family protein n=1 Tax=Bosea sp. (in: a-proteobacteria) TaxID=1871050 RepID=UPI00263A3125|nr:O-antigen ligase family protein [Bosea sp. (in: a-proteobacteria)]MCO5092623.1 O-antigen ligase family protein [Bosea sp. (in: a-proteobacteria)]
MSPPRLADRPETVPDRAGLPRLLTGTGAALMVLMPLAMWLANRSSPLMLALAGASLAAAAVAAGDGRALAARLRRLAASPPALALAAFLAWALVSILWSHRPAASLSAWGELVLPIACALAIAACGRFRPRPAWLRALAVAIILACLLTIVELASGLSQRAALGVGKLMGFVFNRTAITALVLAVPAIHGLWSLSRSDRLLAIVLAFSVAALVLRSESASAGLGLAVVVLCWALAHFRPRLMLTAAASAFVLAMALAPVLGLAARDGLPALILDRFPAMTGQARIDIWVSFGEAARARPIAGAGFGTSAAMREHPVAAAVSPEHRELLGVGHPHDMPLQAWAETGVIGAGLLVLAGLALLARLGRLTAREMAPRLALFTGAFAIAAVGHGAWQGWWIAVLGAAILWFAQGEDHA